MNDAAVLQFVPVLGALLGALCLWAAMRSARRQRLVKDLPTSRTTGVFIGLVELKGTAESEQPLTCYLACQPCVYYTWDIQEHWSRTVTETYTDNEGKTQTRTRHQSGWTTVASGGQSQDFYLKDDCGVILIRAEGAKIEPQPVFSKLCYPGDPLYYGKGPAHSVSDSDHYRQFSESAVLLHVPLYVMGQARQREDIVAAEIAYDRNAPMFLISTRSEEQVASGFGWGKWGWGFLGMLLTAGGFAALGANTPMGPNPFLIGGMAVAYLFAAAGCWVWMAFNSLIDLRQRVRQGWSQVDIQLKRRHDLIPNLVNTIKGIRDYEQNLQTELAKLRTQLEATPPGQPGPDYEACQKILIAVAERYPEITAQPNFLNLQKQLSNTEQRIALARSYFNEIATYFNTRLEIVPDRYIAALANMKPQPLMDANEFERAPVNVNLA